MEAGQKFGTQILKFNKDLSITWLRVLFNICFDFYRHQKGADWYQRDDIQRGETDVRVTKCKNLMQKPLCVIVFTINCQHSELG